MSSLKYIFTIVFVIIFANANAKVNIDNQIDSLDAKLQKNYEIGASAKENLELIRKLYELTKISEPYLALEYAGQALQLGVTEDNKTIQAEWSEAIADIYFEQKVYYLAMEDYFNAYSLYLSDGEKEKCAYALLKYGDTYFIQNVEDVAMSNYVKAMKVTLPQWTESDKWNWNVINTTKRCRFSTMRLQSVKISKIKNS